MRICILTSSFPANAQDAASAAGLFIRDFAAGLQHRGHDVIVVTPDKQIEPVEVIPGVLVRRFTWLGKDRRISGLRVYWPVDLIRIWSLFRAALSALEGLHQEKALDHVLSMWAVPAGLIARWFKSKYSIRYTVWCLGSDIHLYGRVPLLRRVVAAALKNADFTFANSERLSEEAAALSNKKVDLLYSTRRLDPAISERMDFGTRHPRYLFIGRYERVKGPDLLIKAMITYVAAGGKGQLAMFGGGPLERLLHKQAARPELVGRIEIHGFAPMQQLISAYVSCDAVVIPSRRESLPVVLSEAMQMQKPVIVADAGDLGILVNQYKAGMVFPAGQSAALGQALLDFEHSDVFRYLPGIKKLQARFDLEQSIDQWLSIIRKNPREQ